MRKKPYIDFREDTGVKNVLMNITDVHHRHSGKPQPRMALAHPFLLSIAGSLSEPYSYHYILGVKFSMPRKSLCLATKPAVCIYSFLNIIIVISFLNS